MASRTIFRLPIRSRPLKPLRSLQSPIHHRSFTSTFQALQPRKDSQDRESINTEATEYSKSGTDDSSAAQSEAAYDPSNTDPAKAKDVAGEGGGPGNPLEVSPANPEVSKQHKGQEGGAENSGKDEGASQSGHGSGKKAGGA